MKRKNLIFVSALLASQSMMAQTPYMNENYMPTDLIGSARYVGMGGAVEHWEPICLPLLLIRLHWDSIVEVMLLYHSAY